MPENHQPEQLKNNPDTPSDEIELIDLLRVIWKWKYLILIGTFVCAFAAGAISVFTPPLYRIGTLLELDDIKILSDSSDDGNIEVAKNLETSYLVPPANIEAMLELGVLNSDIRKYLKKSNDIDTQHLPKLDVTVQGDGGILEINCELPNSKLCVAVLNSLNPVLIKRYEKKIELLQSSFEQVFMYKTNELKALEDKIIILQSASRSAAQKMHDLEEEIDFLQKNIKSLIALRDKTFVQDNIQNLLIGLQFNASIQQSFELLRGLRNDFSNYNLEIKNSEIELNGLNLRVNREKEEIKKFENWKNNIQYIRVDADPASNIQIARKSTEKYMIVGAIAGVISMIFLSFLLDYILITTKQPKKRTYK